VRTAFTGGNRVTLEVWDDGPGVPEAIRARIFDPFFTTKPPAVGTGLGLAIVLSFVRQNGGTITLFSPPHGGARFVVELPVAPAAGIQDSGENTELSGEGVSSAAANATLEGAPTGNVPRILVVEDEPTVANLIADVLREEGMHVDVLPESRQALQNAKTETYDLAICDVKMPGMDGQRFYQALLQRRDPLCEHILFVTGDIVAPRTQAFLDRYHLARVAKPFRMEELSGAVQRMLRKTRAPAAPRPSAKAKEA